MDKVELKLGDGTQEVILREGQAKPVYNYQGFGYTALSTDAFIKLIQEKANKENAVIAYTNERMQVILDDAVVDRNKDTVTYQYQSSEQYKEWRKILSEEGFRFEQKEIVDFMRRREETELDEMEMLLASLQNFKYVTSISGEASYEDGNNYTFGIKVGDTEGQTSLPKVIVPKIEFFNESGFLQDVEVEIEVVKPKSDGEKLSFKLSCPKIERYIKAAVKYEVDKLKEQLDGYLIVTGVIY